MRRQVATRGGMAAAVAALLAVLPSTVAHAQLALTSRAPPESSWPRFHCEDGVCPIGVGVLLAFRDDGQVGFCTATLIANDRVVTAAHCIAPGTRSAMHFFLPDERAVTIAWRAVRDVIHEEVRERGADHAILRLERALDAPFVPLARAAIEPDGTLTMVRASPHADRTVFIRRERCIVMPQALRAGVTAPSSAIVRIAGCTILAGNSGAPLLDVRGRVVAVVSSGLAPAGVAIILAPWLTGPAPFVGTISSLACLPATVAGGVPPSMCRLLSHEPDRGLISSDDARDAAVDAQREALAERLIEWDAEDDAIGWDLDRQVTGDRTFAVPVPGCIDVAELERTGRIDRRGRFTIVARVPAWQAVAFMGADVRMVPVTERVAVVRMVIHGRLDEARERASIRIDVRRSRLPRPRPRADVPTCD